MKLVNYQDVKLEDVESEGASKTKIRWLISEKDKAPNFAMRVFEVEPNGHTPFHNHEWEHEVFILAGKGELTLETGTKEFQKGDVIFIDPDMKHNFKNTGEEVLKFICVIPLSNKPKKKSVNPFASGVANNC